MAAIITAPDNQTWIHPGSVAITLRLMMHPLAERECYNTR